MTGLPEPVRKATDQIGRGTMAINKTYRDIDQGDRVELVACGDPYTGLTPGSQGVFRGALATPFGPQLWVEWDNGSSLMLVPEDGDDVRKINA